jgi:hypothetical protein
MEAEMSTANVPDGKPPTKVKRLTEMAVESNPKESAELADERSAEIDSGQWSWGDIHQNDCAMTGAFLILRSDGTGRFGSFVQTSDATDVWLVRGLALLDNHGVELWRIPQFNGPEMTQDNHQYAFFNENLFFPAHLFPFIISIRMYYHC